MATTKRKPTKSATPRRTVRRKPTPVAAAPDAAWLVAVRAMESKKADEVRVLDLRPVTTFADHMLICSGGNPRQIQAIADEVEQKLKQAGDRPNSVEGYTNAEWILMDYGDFVVNVFSKTAREYYDLERLWRDAPEVAIPEENGKNS